MRVLRPDPVQAKAWVELFGWERLRAEVRNMRRPGQAWRILQWLARASMNRAANRAAGWVCRRRETLEALRRAAYPLGAEIAALGPVSSAVFRASRRVTTAIDRRRIDVAVADTAAHASGIDIPAVVLAEAPGRLSVPAVDPLTNNPVGWVRDAGDAVATLGPIGLLPPEVKAHRVLRPGDRHRLRRMHHVEDMQAFHRDVTARAGTLARLAALGVVVHLADGDRRLAELLGTELYSLMTSDVRDLDLAARERLSIRMRRAALREHSLRSRARQLCAQVLPDPPLPPRVSILLATRRPDRLPRALATVVKQTYPRLELVLALHGRGFADVERHLANLACPVKVVRLASRHPLGSALNLATAAASGTLLAKMDDDDLYGADHVWDLVLAQEYSQAALVGKGVEFVYLAASDRTVHCFSGGGETYATPGRIGGGAMLIVRRELRRAGGWRRVPRRADQTLIADVLRVGGRVYRTHGTGFVLVRHGHRHTWEMSDDYFLARADRVSLGWNPVLADLVDPNVPHPLRAAPK